MTNTQDYDDHSWLDGSTLDSAAGPLSGEANRTLEAETLERERDAAMDEGRHEAFGEIMRRGESITAIACNGDQADRETWKAQGALEIWRVAYAAIYREMLAIKDQAEAMVCGAGVPDGLPGITPREVAHTISNAKLYEEMGWSRKEVADDKAVSISNPDRHGQPHCVEWNDIR
jgi:hypothetical protein